MSPIDRAHSFRIRPDVGLMDGFQQVLVSLHIIWLPEGFLSMDFILAGWMTTQIRAVRHIVVLDGRDIVAVVFFFRVGVGFELIRWRLASLGRSTLDSTILRPMFRPIAALSKTREFLSYPV